MNDQQNQETDQREILICQAFKELLINPPLELSYSLGKQGFFQIANFLINIPVVDKLNISQMVEHIGSYLYQPGHEVLKEFYLRTYQQINPEDIQTIVKKIGDPDDEADNTSITKRLDNEGRDILEYLQKWATEIKGNEEQSRVNEDDNQPPTA